LSYLPAEKLKPASAPGSEAGGVYLLPWQVVVGTAMTPKGRVPEGRALAERLARLEDLRGVKLLFVLTTDRAVEGSLPRLVITPGEFPAPEVFVSGEAVPKDQDNLRTYSYFDQQTVADRLHRWESSSRDVRVEARPELLRGFALGALLLAGAGAALSLRPGKTLAVAWFPGALDAF